MSTRRVRVSFVDVPVETALLTAVCQACRIEGLSLPANATPRQRQRATNAKHQLAVEMAIRAYVRATNAYLDALKGGR